MAYAYTVEPATKGESHAPGPGVRLVAAGRWPAVGARVSMTVSSAEPGGVRTRGPPGASGSVDWTGLEAQQLRMSSSRH